MTGNNPGTKGDRDDFVGFDGAAVRALATRQNAARVELIVSRARVKSQIYALLTPEQRELAQKIRAEGKGRHGHQHGM